MAAAIPYLSLTLTLLTWTIWRAPTNASKWRMGFNSAFKGLKCCVVFPVVLSPYAYNLMIFWGTL